MPWWPADYISRPPVSDSKVGASGGYPPPGYPRLMGVSFVTQTRLLRYVRVRDTSCVLRVPPQTY